MCAEVAPRLVKRKRGCGCGCAEEHERVTPRSPSPPAGAPSTPSLPRARSPDPFSFTHLSILFRVSPLCSARLRHTRSARPLSLSYPPHRSRRADEEHNHCSGSPSSSRAMAAFAAPPGHPAHNQIMALSHLVDAPVAIKAPDAGLKVRDGEEPDAAASASLSLLPPLSPASPRSSPRSQPSTGAHADNRRRRAHHGHGRHRAAW